MTNKQQTIFIICITISILAIFVCLTFLLGYFYGKISVYCPLPESYYQVDML